MKRTLKLLGVGIILLGLLIVLILIPKRQELREKAREPEKTGNIVISPTYDREQNQVERIDIRFRTGNEQKRAQKVSSLSFRLIYLTNNPSEFVIVDADGGSRQEIAANKILGGSGEWFFPINKVTRLDDKILVDFAAVNINPGGYSAANYTNIATIYIQKGTMLKANLTKLKFDSEKTQIFSKNPPVGDISDLSGE